MLWGHIFLWHGFLISPWNICCMLWVLIGITSKSMYWEIKNIYTSWLEKQTLWPRAMNSPPMTTLTLDMLIKMPRPLLIASQSEVLIQIVDTNSHTEWQTVEFQISWRSHLNWIYTICKGRAYQGSTGPGLIADFTNSLTVYTTTSL